MTAGRGLIFLGAPGSGKGTQAQILATDLQIPHISTGDMLRQAIADATPLGQQAKSYMEQGELVPDDLILGLIQERLGQPDAQKGWILDGFPRNQSQAEFLDNLLTQIHHEVGWVINLHVNDDVIVQRLLQRGRADDQEETIRHRLEVYREKTAPLLAFYQAAQKLHTVNGDRSMEAISDSLRMLLTT
ncbi:adenylate kinase [Synechocystis sp. LKSZ1]|uniref:adenylate kinase n=1 Tax=Synechocystis sp. LKSZ1 TaxID=3144951 RepID=UPI00336C0CDF